MGKPDSRYADDVFYEIKQSREPITSNELAQKTGLKLQLVQDTVLWLRNENLIHPDGRKRAGRSKMPSIMWSPGPPRPITMETYMAPWWAITMAKRNERHA